MILDPIDGQGNFIVDGKKDENVGVITNYILQEIHFRLSGIDCPHQVLKKFKSLFNKVDESHIMQLEELINFYPHSFEKIEDYLACVKEPQLKLDECGNNF